LVCPPELTTLKKMMLGVVGERREHAVGIFYASGAMSVAETLDRREIAEGPASETFTNAMTQAPADRPPVRKTESIQSLKINGMEIAFLCIIVSPWGRDASDEEDR
jgi:hypothetical protein